eukprot:CAMPEP_0115157988 /NCGR_PEP_ID=MMETSP0227-20121206/69332_1 /TAXON_ID=89957 /ORGANISM="Polarella glacialis, Strain CCMP 1383" /LENGTH=35 /DNA_ID= /DNA_START= /DNA_END= /DNA_ORIENTATION=
MPMKLASFPTKLLLGSVHEALHEIALPQQHESAEG